MTLLRRVKPVVEYQSAEKRGTFERCLKYSPKESASVVGVMTTFNRIVNVTSQRMIKSAQYIIFCDTVGTLSEWASLRMIWLSTVFIRPFNAPATL